MATKSFELPWQLPTDTGKKSPELQQDEIEAWLNEQSMPGVVYAKDLDTAIRLLEQEISARGFALKAH